MNGSGTHEHLITDMTIRKSPGHELQTLDFAWTQRTKFETVVSQHRLPICGPRLTLIRPPVHAQSAESTDCHCHQSVCPSRIATDVFGNGYRLIEIHDGALRLLSRFFQRGSGRSKRIFSEVKILEQYRHPDRGAPGAASCRDVPWPWRCGRLHAGGLPADGKTQVIFNADTDLRTGRTPKVRDFDLLTVRERLRASKSRQVLELPADGLSDALPCPRYVG